MIVTETDRLLLRHVNQDDLDAFAALFADPEVMRFSLGNKSREETLRWIGGCLEDYQPERWGFGLWAVILKSTGQVMGFCGLSKFDDIGGQCEVEVGYRLARPYWGKGFVTEAARAARDHAFSHLGIRRLISLIEADNIPAVRVAEKLGMSLEKVVTKWDRPVGVYAITRPNQPRSADAI